jgi:hypothetical protein
MATWAITTLWIIGVFGNVLPDSAFSTVLWASW